MLVDEQVAEHLPNMGKAVEWMGNFALDRDKHTNT